jgi:hypothetical protein
MEDESCIQFFPEDGLQGIELAGGQTLLQPGAQVIHAQDVPGPETATAVIEKIAAVREPSANRQRNAQQQVDQELEGIVTVLDSSAATASPFLLFAPLAGSGHPQGTHGLPAGLEAILETRQKATNPAVPAQ